MFYHKFPQHTPFFRNGGNPSPDEPRGPAPDWVKQAEGHGVAAERVTDAGSLAQAIAPAMATPGPTLVEAVM
ncbi:thiamine pyrophosphate-dependent enzyme [Pseudorhodobacter turbinis]|uniref:thiamine pyrophosphate-dependent enzyme n=1 Tax=Pseudorhodobacter turbinis TaxID=2500533 RepID=UPI001F0DB6DD|nr:thiamine pyrophosphate-dependent enzyme [Pseudorhodobacter turbinis]